MSSKKSESPTYTILLSRDLKNQKVTPHRQNKKKVSIKKQFCTDFYMYKYKPRPKVYTILLSRDLSPEGIPKEVQLFLLMSYFVLGNVYWTFNLSLKKRLFGTFKMFYCDGTGRDGRDGTDGTGRTVNKSVLQFSSYFVSIQNMYMYSYKHSQKLSPTLLWV